MSTVFTGTAGWSYSDWEGIFYPHKRPKSMTPLRYYARFFDTVEVNSSFYAPPRATTAGGWLRQVQENPRFVFTLKLWRLFTHEKSSDFGDREVEAFRRGIEPLVEAGKLGGMLIQFPWYFRAEEQGMNRVEKLSRLFSDYPLILEVRHRSWITPEHLQFIRDMGLNLCNIDLPLARSSVRPGAVLTGPIGYVRLHGRNYDTWFRKDAGRDEKYDYLYSEQELEEWMERIEILEKGTDTLYVIANNHFRGQAAVNALQIRSRLEGRAVDVPPTLVEQYAVLRPHGREHRDHGEEQKTLWHT
jgi:uncharacterized protein YecE (DUF72 family)